MPTLNQSAVQCCGCVCVVNIMTKVVDTLRFVLKIVVSICVPFRRTIAYIVFRPQNFETEVYTFPMRK